MIDIALLKVLKHKEQFDKVFRYIPSSAIDKRTRAITQDIKKYFDLHPDETTIDMQAFRSLFFTSWHKGMSDEDVKFYNGVLDQMAKEAPEAIKKTLINQLLELEFATDLGNIVTRYQQEEEIDLVPQVNKLCEAIRATLERTNNFEFAQLTDEIVQEDVDNSGLEWALPCLNRSMRPLRGGDMIIVAARPDAGKTSFLTQQLQHMAGQTDLPIIWLNNESTKERILKRSLQSALRATNSELMEKQKNGTLMEEFVQIVGAKDKIRVYDIHGWDTGKIEDLLEATGDVGLVVFDMLDNVKFHGVRSDARTDQILEMMYQWGRELSVRIGAPVMATSQVSTEGDGLQFPSMGMLKDSKTGKQGACDVILMIGKSNDPLLEHQRFLSVPKNKLKIEGSESLREEVLFNPDRGVYVDNS